MYKQLNIQHKSYKKALLYKQAQFNAFPAHKHGFTHQLTVSPGRSVEAEIWTRSPQSWCLLSNRYELVIVTPVHRSFSSTEKHKYKSPSNMTKLWLDMQYK